MENASLRESLASVQKELISLLNRRQAMRQEESSVSVLSFFYNDVIPGPPFPSVYIMVAVETASFGQKLLYSSAVESGYCVTTFSRGRCH